jgi:hypothetical protein
LKNPASSPRLKARTPWSWGALLLSASALVAACGGVSDVQTAHTAGAGGSSGSGGTAANGGANTDGVCQDGERRCDGDVPQSCQSGKWTPEAACKVGEACSGAGACAAFRLVGASIGSFGERAAEPVAGASLVLKEQTLSAVPRACSDKLCITGDLR